TVSTTASTPRLTNSGSTVVLSVGVAPNSRAAKSDSRVGNGMRSSGHDVHAAVHVQRLSGKAARIGRGEERAGEADVGDVHQLAERRALRGGIEHEIEVLQSRGRARLERPG